MKCAATNHPFRNQTEEALHLVEPGTACRSEVKMESATFLGLKPALDGGTFMGRVVGQHDVDGQIRRHFLFDLIEELQKLTHGRINTLSPLRDNIHYFQAGPQEARGIDINTMYGESAPFSFLNVDKKPLDAEKQIFEATWSDIGRK